MTVVLRRADGITREYPVRAPFSWGRPRTPCGAGECEHVGCAMDFARESINRYWIGIGFDLLVIPVFLFNLFLDIRYLSPILGRSPLHFSNLLLVLGIVLLLVMIFSWREKLLETRELLNELEEFRSRGTIQGIPAEQVTT